MARSQTTSNDLADLTGRLCNWIVPKANRVKPASADILVTCRITDARNCMFGRTEVQITPAEGYGKRWVALDSVELI